MELCGREECVYKAVEKMVGDMKSEIAKKQNIPYSDQLMVAKIYDLNAAVLSEACRRTNKVDKKDCDASRQFNKKNLSMDTFIFLNQLKEDGFITGEFKEKLFCALLEMDPEIRKMVENDTSGLV